ncbi:hypothetical protein ACIBF7_00505 [Nonomuraea sp. NPDC050478]|uniref:hypothetical protein n=1 Tax=Nonomuraea sp. NPDC050478 TaxID=3364365 RepID=UPI00378A6B61
MFQGQNPEKLVIPDGKVRPAGVEVIEHGQPYFAAVPEYGPRLEKAWVAGQREWLTLSGDSKLTTAEKSRHHIYADRPDIAVRAIERVPSPAARAASGG